MEQPYRAAPDIVVLPSFVFVPGFGIVPANAFLIEAAEPVLVDTGVTAESDQFMATLRSLIDLKQLRWIWLTHTDPDHIGSLRRVLAEAPFARLITTFVGLGKLTLFGGLQLDRVYLLNPGQSLNVGDRRLTTFKPPVFDAPETTGLFDDKADALFTADCFGAVVRELRQDAAEIPSEDLNRDQTLWATVDAPWIHCAEPSALARALDSVRRMAPDVILSSHLPPARALTEAFIQNLTQARTATPFVGPDQAAFEAAMALTEVGTEAP
ncbi:MAG: MBL fold metallo-hydrolase [Myxococcales bacterium]|jgi:flavorubredoxin